MSKNYKANPITAPLITRPGESKEYVGTRNVTGLLPEIFRTDVNKRFLDSTLEQLMSTGSLQAINHYVGEKTHTRKNSDSYVEDGRTSDPYQFTPGLVNKDSAGRVTNALAYDDLLHNMNFSDVQLNQNSRVFDEEGYTLDLPINIDMFINYHTYFWALDDLPVATLTVTAENPVAIDDIIGSYQYTTPVLANGKTLALKNGMKVSFNGAGFTGNANFETDDVLIVDGVESPNGITFTLHTRNNKRIWSIRKVYGAGEAREYTVEQRWSLDQSAWARSNLWVKEDAIISQCEYADIDSLLYAKDVFRATRPIIEYRANIQKYNFGTQHLDFVDYMYDSINPATDIIGNAQFNLAEHLISEDWVHKGYIKGDLVKLVVDNEITYWDCKETHTDDKDPTLFENKKYWNRVYARNIANGETVLFVNSGNSDYDNKIFKVSGVGSAITLSPEYDTSSFVQGDKVVCVNGYNAVFYESQDNLIYSGSEWFWNGSDWVYGQQKEGTSQGALFQLYDVDLVELQNESVYPNSTFTGDRIFDFGKSTGRVDESLGFSPRYVDYGNSPGLSFDFGLGANRYHFNVIRENSVYHQTFDTGSTKEIPGYYFYKTLNDEKYYNGWKLLRQGQPVKRHANYISDSSDIVVNLGTTDLNTDNKFIINKSKGAFKFSTTSTENSRSHIRRVSGNNPHAYVTKDRVFHIQTLFVNSEIEFVDFKGNALTNVTINTIDDYNSTITVGSDFDSSVIRYRDVNDNSITGLIYVYENSDLINDNQIKNIQVLVNGEQSNLYVVNNSFLTVANTNAGDVIDVYWWSDSELETTADGNFMPADTHLYNAFNEWATHASFGDLQEHLRDQMTSIPGFTGNFFGKNNYNSLLVSHDFGGTIRKQPYSTALINQLSSDVDTNVYNSIKYAASNYKKFKMQFLRKVEQLHKQTAIETPVYELVDRALSEINLGRNSESPFANSDMAMFTEFELAEYTLLAALPTTEFELPSAINTYDDTANHIQLWAKDDTGWHSLCKDVDYTLSDNKVTLVKTLDIADTGSLVVRWYPVNSVSFVPPSAVKLGLVRPSVPQFAEFDIESTNEATSNVLIGHDGSVTLRTGTSISDRSVVGFSIEDAALYDLELRIYNNLNAKLNDIVDFKEIMPNANQVTSYNWDDYIASLETDFKRFFITSGLTTINDPTYFDETNKFTWNYSSVGPGIGGWRGLYNYYFNTDRPHTHPWEMFGYNTKPTWWDANYDWQDATKRSALISALKVGLFNDPSEEEQHNLAYAYTGYDWDNNTLVTLAGALNDPATAGVVAEPGIAQRAAEFKFGDMSNIEYEWIRSSEFKFLQILALLRLRPLWVTNNFFESANRKVIRSNSIPDDILINSNSKQLGSYKTTSLSNVQYSDSIIERILVKSSTEVNATPSISIFGNFGTDSQARAIVENNKVVAVSVTDPGKDYQSKPGVVFSDGNVVAEAYLKSNVKKYFIGLSNAVLDFAQYNRTSATNIAQRFEYAGMQPIIKAAGFINPNRQSFVLESSQDKGKVTVPEENTQTILYLNQPNHETFMGGIQFIKQTVGFKAVGIDRNTMYSSYFPPSENSKKIISNFSNTVLERYESYSTVPKKLYYGETLPNLQETYNFILGHGEYLKSQGWVTNWRSTANDFVFWNETASVGDTFVCIPDSQKYEIYDGERGYYDTIINRYDGVNNLIDHHGNEIEANKIIVSRPVNSTETAITTIEAKDENTNILGLRLYRVELEHAIILSNSTDFDDVLYNAALGQRHKRIVWRGARTKNWNGKLYSPGYIVNGNTIIDNLDTSANSSLDYFTANSAGVNNEQAVNTARFNIGYNKPQWADYLQLDNDSVFNFIKGTRKYKGTKYGLNAFMRNTSILGNTSDANLYEIWAVRTADFGDVRSRDTVEFEINSDVLTTSPQVVKFHSEDFNDTQREGIIDIDPTSNLLVTGSTDNVFRTRPSKKYNVLTITDSEKFNNDFVTAGLPLITETDFRVLNKEDFEQFPIAAKDVYDFVGDYQNVEAWNNRVSYKTNDKVIYDGFVWKMVDEDGSSGLQRPNDPIEVVGRTSLPVISSEGQTIVIDNTVVTIKRTSESSTLETIQLTGSGNLNVTGVPNGSTLVIGQSSTINQTLIFENETSSIVYQPATKTGNTVNFTVVGDTSGDKELIIDGISVVFDEAESIITNVTAYQGFTTAFGSSFVKDTNLINSYTDTRISVIEDLRISMTNNSGATGWQTFLSNYFTEDAGLDINYILSVRDVEGIGTGSTAELDALIENDLNIINAIANTSYTDAASVPAADVTTAANKLSTAPYISNIKSYLINNNAAFTPDLIIATSAGTGAKIYNSTEVINKINSTSIPGVTASLTQAGNLLLSKNIPNSERAFAMVISAGTANAELGLASGQETIRSSGITVIDTPDLNAQETVDQINAAGIPNVSAIALSSGQIRILSNGATLYIGSGNANSFLGIDSGIIPARVTTVSVDRTSDLTDTVSSINAANITGITASNSNNRLKIVSTNEEMTIGSNGTANVTLGITPQTYFATTSTISNEFQTVRYDILGNAVTVFEKVENDPFLFSIWTADNSEKSNINAGYNVYQAMNFGMHITRACAGVEEADEALIEIDMADYTRDYPVFHNLNVGDYVYIAGSNTVPSIDGVKKVTRIDSDKPYAFYIDEYIDEEGSAGNVYPMRSVRFSSKADLDANFNVYKVNPTSTEAPVIFRYNFGDSRPDGSPIYAFVDDDGDGAPAVYEYTGRFLISSGNFDGQWQKVRIAPPQSRSDLVENVKIYDAVKQTLITSLEVFDPAKGIIPGFVDNEIDFKSVADMANYNNSTYYGYRDNEDAWTDRYIGMRWWDLSTSVYLDYEQGSEKYQQQYWGRLFTGSEVEIYEWIYSPVLPEEYVDFVRTGKIINGQLASGQPYSKVIDGETRYFWTESVYFNPITSRTETNYYFWVKNKNSATGVRNYNTLQLANILTDFKNSDVAWAAPSQSDSLLIANADKFLSTDTVVQVNQAYESNSLPLNEWTLIGENDPDETIPEYLHIKIRDSLAGYNNYHDVYTYTEWNNSTTYYKEDVVIKDGKFFICLDDEVIANDPVVDTFELQWAQIYNYSLPAETEAADIEVWRGQPVPDLRLHPYNRYGHLTRPVQSLYRDIVTARQNFVDAINDYLTDICVTSTLENWDHVFYKSYVEGEVEYKLDHYWNFKDWVYREYSDDGRITFQHDSSIRPDFEVDTIRDIMPIPVVPLTIDIPEGSYVYVRNSSHADGVNRPELWVKQNGEFKLRWKKYGTIEFSDELWNESKFGHGFDAAGFDISGYDSGSANIIKLLFDTLREDVFVGQFKDRYNKLWFRCLYQAVINGTADDFAFKTTYVKLSVDHPLIMNPKSYQNYNTTAIEQYFDTIKPFHTKLHASVQRPTVSESMGIGLTEIDRNTNITLKFDRYTRDWQGDTVLSGGTFESDPENIDALAFSETDANIEVVYNGNYFDQPEVEGLGDELVGLDLLENIRISVQTNASGDTVTSDTRSFQMNMFTNYDIQENIVIVDNNNTTLSQDIAKSDTTIELTNAAVLRRQEGVIWINNERITYGAIDGNTLMYCHRGTLGTSVSAHTANTRVVDANTSIAANEKFSDYGDSLSYAYNDLGSSLATDSTGLIHRYIRNAGSGTI